MSSRSPLIQERRVSNRFSFQVRVSVLGVDHQTAIHNEVTETLDLSTTGLRLTVSYPVRVGDHININADQPQLRAHLAIFVVRWVQPVGDRFLIGAQLISPAERWQILAR